MRKKIFVMVAAVLLAASVLYCAASMFLLEENNRRETEEQLEDYCELAASMVPDGNYDEAAASMAGTELRVTFLDETGQVLGDSAQSAGEMEEHSQREEVQQALSSGSGTAIRLSATTGDETMYVARRMKNGKIVRIAMRLDDIWKSSQVLWRSLSVLLALLMLGAALLAWRFSGAILQPVNQMTEAAKRVAEGDYGVEIAVPSTKELGELAASFNAMSVRLRETVNALQEENQKLRTLENMRSEFVANVSHELKTPLTSISGFTETLLCGALDDKEQARKFLQIIHIESDRLMRLINDILSLSELESGAPRRMERLDVWDALSYVEEVMQPAAQRREVRLIVDLSGAEGLFVWGNDGWLKQMLINLTDNAIKYTLAGGTVRLSARRAGDHAELSVRDSGIGIPEESQKRLFERFYRVDKGRSRSMGGTGLGLAIVKHIARNMGGDVTVESEVGKGSCFTVTLPLKAEENDRPALPAQSETV